MTCDKRGQFGDTTFTKVFVGGLAWETQKDTMKKYFEQFGDILEAVVITDKATGRSKGYGFVTFREPEAAMRACVDAAPVIDGRRANCNLGFLGAQRSKPSTPKHGGRNLRGMRCFPTAIAFSSAATFPPHYYGIPQGLPFNLYGYSPCSPDYSNYATNYYSLYGGATGQYPVYGGGLMTGAGTAFYPYLQFGEGMAGPVYSSGQGYGVQFPQHLFPYSTGSYPQHYGAPMALAPTPPLQ
ncbi:hypothetical protein ERO13_A08G229300v2 [Gossypium hirsutum]|uniref:RRM domain-containing protein n=4 Tax=Gossypium TaxID=3633 RepID=A0A5J5UWD8_GOSBA|nr:probable RNA-binding protein ARP1 [Gossypium hirsutum]KAB2071794.1 hypothetical protein ES319_A08G246900v1 [Gossypium barbadense]KAG4189550.1 hypothetical protein ERO13_A08G229300v2 [Gossypium hirsutum]TYH07912.1 hypothetical protein ES288_A08G272500v1 [Gossypium darwinii]TYI16686.1 hypothetical protein ES332_A08G271000v1 [Gossypium tomentosum]